MIRFVLLQDQERKTRLAKSYVPFEETEKHKAEYKAIIERLGELENQD